MRYEDSERLHRAADFSDSAATELSTAAAKLEMQGDTAVANVLRAQAQTHRTKAIRLRAMRPAGLHEPCQIGSAPVQFGHIS